MHSKVNGRTESDTGWGWRLGVGGCTAVSGRRVSRVATVCVNRQLPTPNTRVRGPTVCRMVMALRPTPMEVSDYILCEATIKHLPLALIRYTMARVTRITDTAPMKIDIDVYCGVSGTRILRLVRGEPDGRQVLACLYRFLHKPGCTQERPLASTWILISCVPSRPGKGCRRVSVRLPPEKNFEGTFQS